MASTLSLYGEKTRITISGDEAACKNSLGEVNRILYHIRKLVEHQGVPIYRLEKKFADGTKIEVLTVHGREYVWFHKPLKSGSVEEITQETLAFVYYNQVHTGWGTGPACLWVYKNGVWVFGGDDNSVGAQHCKAIRNPDLDNNGVGRCVAIRSDGLVAIAECDAADPSWGAGAAILWTTDRWGRGALKEVRRTIDSDAWYFRTECYFDSEGRLYWWYGNDAVGYTIERSAGDFSQWEVLAHQAYAPVFWGNDENMQASIYAQGNSFRYGWGFGSYYYDPADPYGVNSSYFVTDGAGELWPALTGTHHNPYNPTWDQNPEKMVTVGLYAHPVNVVSKSTVCQHNNYSQTDVKTATPSGPVRIVDPTYHAPSCPDPVDDMSCCGGVDEDGYAMRCPFCGQEWFALYVGGSKTIFYLKGKGDDLDNPENCTHEGYYNKLGQRSDWGSYPPYYFATLIEFWDSYNQSYLRRNGTVVWESRNTVQRIQDSQSIVNYVVAYKQICMRTDPATGYWVVVASALMAPGATVQERTLGGGTYHDWGAVHPGILFSADDGLTWQHLSIDAITLDTTKTLTGTNLTYDDANPSCDILGSKVVVAFPVQRYGAKPKVIFAEGTISNGTISAWKLIDTDVCSSAQGIYWQGTLRMCKGDSA